MQLEIVYEPRNIARSILLVKSKTRNFLARIQNLTRAGCQIIPLHGNFKVGRSARPNLVRRLDH
jgi:hypothetical protein